LVELTEKNLSFQSQIDIKEEEKFKNEKDGRLTFKDD